MKRSLDRDRDSLPAEKRVPTDRRVPRDGVVTDSVLFQRMRAQAIEAVDPSKYPNRKRTRGWERRLSAVLVEAHAKPFQWGVSDCVLFACDVVEAMTGIDPGARWRGRYDSFTSAVQAIRVYARGGTLEDAAIRMMDEIDLPQITATFAQAGDVALIMLDGTHAIGVIYDHRIAAKTPTGIGFVPRSAAIRAWAI